MHHFLLNALSPPTHALDSEVCGPIRARCRLLLKFNPSPRFQAAPTDGDSASALPPSGQPKAFAREGSIDSLSRESQKKAVDSVTAWLSVQGSHGDAASGDGSQRRTGSHDERFERVWRKAVALLLATDPVGASGSTPGPSMADPGFPAAVYRTHWQRRRASILRLVRGVLCPAGQCSQLPRCKCVRDLASSFFLLPPFSFLLGERTM